MVDTFENVTIMNPPSENDDKLISDEMTELLSIVLLYGVTPGIAVVGITLNIFSVIVLAKQGFSKCSNILLFSLALMDIGFLTAYNSLPNLLYSVQGNGKFLYSESISHFLFVFYQVLIVVDYGMTLSGLTMPMLITLERLIVVFLPLRFGQFITSKRCWILIAGVVAFWVSSMIYTCFWYRFEYAFDASLNRSVGLMEKSALYHKDLPGIPIFEEIFWSMKLPPFFTLFGCIAIFIKVKQASLKREKMTSKASSTSRTTKTLLAVCCGYLLTCFILAVPTYLPDKFSSYSVTSDSPTNTAKITYQVLNIWLEINSSWNFIVYVAFNKNFRQTFKEIVKNICFKRCNASRGVL